MVNLNMPPESSQEGSNVEDSNDGIIQTDIEIYEGSTIRYLMTDPYQVKPNDGENAKTEPMKIFQMRRRKG